MPSKHRRSGSSLNPVPASACVYAECLNTPKTPQCLCSGRPPALPAAHQPLHSARQHPGLGCLPWPGASRTDSPPCPLPGSRPPPARRPRCSLPLSLLSGSLRTETSSSGPFCHPSPAGQRRWGSACSPASHADSFARAAPSPAAGSGPEGDEQSWAGARGLLLFHKTRPSILRVFLGKGQAEMRQFAIQNTQGE